MNNQRYKTVCIVGYSWRLLSYLLSKTPSLEYFIIQIVSPEGVPAATVSLPCP